MTIKPLWNGQFLSIDDAEDALSVFQQGFHLKVLPKSFILSMRDGYFLMTNEVRDELEKIKKTGYSVDVLTPESPYWYLEWIPIEGQQLIHAIRISG
jgi:hypothetical protein